MAINYTTVARVVAQLGWVDEVGDRPTLTSSSIPTVEEVTEAIEDAESYIESVARTAWKSKTITKEIHSMPEQYYRGWFQGLIVQLGNRFITAITLLNIWQGQSYTDLVATGTEGSGPQDGDYYPVKEMGLLYINNFYPSTFYEASIQISYTHGQTTVPPAIRRATTYLAAVYLIEAGFDFVYTLREGQEGMSNKDKAEKWEKRAYDIIERYKEVTPLYIH